jgi:phosphatidylserine decarboxylase precursor
MKVFNIKYNKIGGVTVANDTRNYNNNLNELNEQCKMINCTNLTQSNTYELTNCNISDEYYSKYQNLGIKGQKVISYIPGHQKILQKYTDYCDKTWNKVDKNKVIDFLKTFKIDYSDASKCKDKTFDECVKEYKTQNEIFSRELLSVQKKATNIEISNYTIISPATCRCLFFDNIEKTTELWIKGQQFTLSSLLNISQEELNTLGLTDPSIIISRLAPQDYHNYHSPVNGEIIKITDIKNGTLYSVNPIIVNSNINVFTKNKRKNIFIKTKFGIVIMCIIGATCVGSIKLENHLKEFQQKSDNQSITIKAFDKIGKFLGGGSTIITIFNNNTNDNTCNIIKKRSENKPPFETYVEVGTVLCVKNQISK